LKKRRERDREQSERINFFFKKQNRGEGGLTERRRKKEKELKRV
jgi:hypothetical protein